MRSLPPTTYNDTRVRLGTVFMIGVGCFLALIYGLVGIGRDIPGFLAGIPVVLIGVAIVWQAHRRWAGSKGEAGGGGVLMALGCLFIVGSLWAAVMFNDVIT